jgi:glycosyltransferase involved in cell wall biosynthesis
MVICDDGSTDATAEIIEEFARTAPFPVRFIRNPEKLGTAKNFEKAISMCIGELIALSDQDDIWMPQRLARQAERMEQNLALGGVFSDAELIDDASRLIGKRLWSNIFFSPDDQKQFQAGHETDELLKRMVVTGATVMVRASVRPLFLPLPALWMHDCWIAFMLTIYSKLELMEEPLIRYRLHSNQQIGVESLSAARRLPLRKRLELGKREEPGKSLLAAQWLEILERHVNSAGDPKNEALLRSIRRRINFDRHRGDASTEKFSRTLRILRNAKNYQVYERGLKAMVRDILLIFI